MKTFYFIFFLTIGNVMVAQNPQEIYESHLKITEQWINLKKGECMSGNAINAASTFFEDVTGRGSEWSNGFDPTAQPSKEDFNFWKKWFAENKERLYWDAQSKSVKVSTR